MNYLKFAKWRLPKFVHIFSVTFVETPKSKMDLKSFHNGYRLLIEFLSKEASPVVGHRSYRTLQIYKGQATYWTKKFTARLESNDFHFITMFKDSRKFMPGFVLMCVTNPQDEKKKWQDVISDSEMKEHLKDLENMYDMLKKRGDAEVMCDGLPWSLFVDSGDLTVWRHSCPNAKALYIYKVYGKYSDVTVEDFKKTQLDLEYRKKWDNQVVKLDIIDKDKDSGAEVIHWVITWPGLGLYANREYCFVRRHFVDKESGDIVIISKTIKHPKVPESSNTVRVKEYYSIMHIRKPKSGAGVEFGLVYMDNSGVVLPGWVSKWAAGSGLEDFLNKVHEAAKALKKS